ncbi:hypothetical protein DY000_02036095 [Brassica cretica]|uniref:Uncharacterized protein n=1 Tax=Brassica cretica TaxID=69181 RepID=A0ABQ7E084_BRACR|nr:hypothetical protein DY000_02036095 [Brassica cretica]
MAMVSPAIAWLQRLQQKQLPSLSIQLMSPHDLKQEKESEDDDVGANGSTRIMEMIEFELVIIGFVLVFILSSLEAQVLDALMLQSNKRKSPKMMSSPIEKKLEFSSSPETDFILRRRGGEQPSISFEEESRRRFDSS